MDWITASVGQLSVKRVRASLVRRDVDDVVVEDLRVETSFRQRVVLRTLVATQEKYLRYMETLQWTRTQTRCRRRMSSVLLLWIWRRCTGEETAENEFTSSRQSIAESQSNTVVVSVIRFQFLAFEKYADDDEYSIRC